MTTLSRKAQQQQQLYMDVMWPRRSPSPSAVRSGSQQGALDSRGEGSEAKHTSLRSSTHHDEDASTGAAKTCATGQYSYSFSRKRAYKRALARAGRDGFARYRGRIMQAHELRAQYRPSEEQSHQARPQPPGLSAQASAKIKIYDLELRGVLDDQ